MQCPKAKAVFGFSWPSFRLGLAVLIASVICLPPVQAGEASKGLLWRVERPGLPASHLFGTVHMDDPRVLDLPEAVTASLGRSQRFVMEVELGPESASASDTAMTFQEGDKLSSHLGEALFGRVTEALGARGIPAAAVEWLKPWAVSTLLSLPEPQTGVFLDMALMNQAVAAGKTVLALETIDEQLAALSGFTMPEQILMLKDTLDQLDKIPEMQAALLNAYLARDLDALLASSERSMKVGSSAALSEKFWKTLVDERNSRMAERLIPMLEQGDAFVAVGALHLPGETGLLAALRRKNFRLSPVY